MGVLSRGHIEVYIPACNSYLVNTWWMNEHIVTQNYHFCGKIGCACEKFLSNKAMYNKCQIDGRSVL